MTITPSYWLWGSHVWVVLMTSLWLSLTDGAHLSDYIRDYQPLQFDHSVLHKNHQRVRRDVDSALKWNFHAYGRTFDIHLRTDQSVFADDHSFEFGGRDEMFDTGFFYEGYLTDTPGSSVHMSIHEGHVKGQVKIPHDTTYYIEPTRHHFSNHSAMKFHTIIYPESRMDLDPYRDRRKNGQMCQGGLYAKMDKIMRAADMPKEQMVYEGNNPYSKYSAEFNKDKHTDHVHHRSKRAAGELAGSSSKTCFMQLRADKLLWDHYLGKYGNDQQQTREAIMSLFASHIKELSKIFLATTFEDPSTSSLRFQGINFVLQRSKIINDCTNYNDNYCRNTLDVENYLLLASEENNNEFCLVHTFTYRDFAQGTLGLAWVADPQSANSGVCGRYGKVAVDSGGVVDRSLNTGIVSFINYNREVPTKVSQITFTHEVGHNFGSQHDDTAVCAPFGTTQSDADDGNYIMFPKATSGNLPHNTEFSPCSRASIFKVLQAVGGVRTNCFQASNQKFCGNNIIEEDEECDCGYAEDCLDPCCNGRSNDPLKSCTRKDGAVCSQSEGNCCTADCKHVSQNTLCLSSTDCTEAAVCNGSSGSCPAPTHKEDSKTFCNTHQAVCQSGECSASVCLNIGWKECFRTKEEGATEEELCYLSCQDPVSKDCVSSLDADAVARHTDYKNLLENIRSNRNETSTGLQLAAGSPCNNYIGYCDTYSKCRQVDSAGPFQRMADLIFDPVTFGNIREWAEDHWWAVLLMAVGVIVFMGVFVKVFSYNTPSQDPRKKRRGAAREEAQGGARGGRGAGANAGARRNDKRGGVYVTEVPMQDRRQGAPAGGGGGGAGPYFDNYGYDNRGERHPPSYHPPSAPPRGSQFDRIQGQRY